MTVLLQLATSPN